MGPAPSGSAWGEFYFIKIVIRHLQYVQPSAKHGRVQGTQPVWKCTAAVWLLSMEIYSLCYLTGAIGCCLCGRNAPMGEYLCNMTSNGECNTFFSIGVIQNVAMVSVWRCYGPLWQAYYSSVQNSAILHLYPWGLYCSKIFYWMHIQICMQWLHYMYRCVHLFTNLVIIIQIEYNIVPC